MRWVCSHSKKSLLARFIECVGTLDQYKLDENIGSDVSGPRNTSRSGRTYCVLGVHTGVKMALMVRTSSKRSQKNDMRSKYSRFLFSLSGSMTSR